MIAQFKLRWLGQNPISAWDVKINTISVGTSKKTYTRSSLVAMVIIHTDNSGVDFFRKPTI